MRLEGPIGGRKASRDERVLGGLVVVGELEADALVPEAEVHAALDLLRALGLEAGETDAAGDERRLIDPAG